MHVLKVRIALVMPPLFYPSHPPVGITALKSYLQQFGHTVQCFDLNTDSTCRSILERGLPSCDDADVIMSTLGLLLRGDDVSHSVATDMEVIADAAAQRGRRPPTAVELGELLFSLKQLLDSRAAAICQADFQAVGCSSFRSTNACALYLLKEIKRIEPSVVTLLGGPTASAEAETIETHCAYVDFIVAGHGEVPMRQLIECAFRSNRRTVRASRRDVKREGLNTYPYLDYSDFRLGDYATDELGLTVQNGCTYACRFCESRAHFGFPDTRRAESVYREMLHLQARHGVNRFHICSAQTNPVAVGLAQLIALAGDDLSWYGPANVDPRLTARDAALFKEGGLAGLRFGVESGSDAVLKLMRKNHRREHALQNIGFLDAVGIPSVAMIIAGFPGESSADHRQTCDLLVSILRDGDHTTAISFPFVLNPHNNGGLAWFETRFGPVQRLRLLRHPVFSYEYEFLLSGLSDHRRVIAQRHLEHRDIIAEWSSHRSTSRHGSPTSRNREACSRRPDRACSGSTSDTTPVTLPLPPVDTRIAQ